MKNTSSIYTNEPNVVMFLNGVKCKVSVDVVYDEYDSPGMPIGAKINIERTNEPLTVGIQPANNGWSNRHTGYYKFGGYPLFLQNVIEPCSDNGVPYTYICTIENEWGDSGNGNVFALIRNFDDDKIVIEDVFVEASCC